MDPETIVITSPTKIITVYGADSYFGAHMVKHLDHTDQMVYGFSQNKDLNLDEEPMLVQGREKIMEVNKTKRQNSPTLKNSQKFVQWR